MLLYYPKFRTTAYNTVPMLFRSSQVKLGAKKTTHGRRIRSFFLLDSFIFYVAFLSAPLHAQTKILQTVILYSLKDKNGTRRVSRKLLHHASGKGLFRVPRPLRPSGRGRRGGVRQVRMFFNNLKSFKRSWKTKFVAS